MSSEHRLTPDEMECLLNGISAEVVASGHPRFVPSPAETPDREAIEPAPSQPSNVAHANNVPWESLRAVHRDSDNSLNAPSLAVSAARQNGLGNGPTAAFACGGLDGDQLREFQSIHEVFADLLAAAWGDKLRTKIDVRVTKVGLRTFGEFVFGLENPTCFLTLDLPPFSGRHCLEIQPTVLFPLIDRLLGGGKHAGPVVRRPLTEIETRLLRRISSIMFEQLRSAWRKYAAIKPEIHAIESNPKLSRCSPPGTDVHVVEFEVSLPFARGAVRLAYQAAALTAVSERLAGLHQEPLGANGHGKGETSEARVLIAEREIDVLAGELRFQVGDVLSTGVRSAQPAKIEIDGQIRFSGRIGQHKGQKAIFILGEADGHTARKLPVTGTP